jgi:hypothetical protein
VQLSQVRRGHHLAVDEVAVAGAAVVHGAEIVNASQHTGQAALVGCVSFPITSAGRFWPLGLLSMAASVPPMTPLENELERLLDMICREWGFCLPRDKRQVITTRTRWMRANSPLQYCDQKASCSPSMRSFGCAASRKGSSSTSERPQCQQARFQTETVAASWATSGDQRPRIFPTLERWFPCLFASESMQ